MSLSHQEVFLLTEQPLRLKVVSQQQAESPLSTLWPCSSQTGSQHTHFTPKNQEVHESPTVTGTRSWSSVWKPCSPRLTAMFLQDAPDPCKLRIWCFTPQTEKTQSPLRTGREGEPLRPATANTLALAKPFMVWLTGRLRPAENSWLRRQQVR